MASFYRNKLLPILFTLFTLQSFAASSTIVIQRDTIINGTWTIPASTIIRFEGGRIKGTGTISGGIIQAPRNAWIFDPTITLKNVSTYDGVFSCWFYGAHPLLTDNWQSIQKSITTVLSNPALHNLILIAGTYEVSKPLKIANLVSNVYKAVSIHFYGEGSAFNLTTQIRYNSTIDYALGIQVGKSVEISGLAIIGKFKSPETPDSIYYRTQWENFNDANGKVHPLSMYAGIVIDPDGTRSNSGSTDVYIHDTYVGGFMIDYLISPNGNTVNAEGIRLENFQCGQARTGISGGQAQEKGNRIINGFSWERLHTFFMTTTYGKGQAGNYLIDGVNLADHPIRFIYNSEKSWYPTHIEHVFAESLYEIGTILSGNLPATISKSVFNLKSPEFVGYRDIFSSNNQFIKMQDCLIRYYEAGDKAASFLMNFKGTATYDNCTFGSPYYNLNYTRFNNCNVTLSPQSRVVPQ